MRSNLDSDGCRTFQASYVKDETQCSPEPPTTAPTNSDETTAIVDHANVFNVIEVGDKCPEQWLAVPMQADDNLWNDLDDGLHEHEIPMCAFKNLPGKSTLNNIDLFTLFYKTFIAKKMFSLYNTTFCKRCVLFLPFCDFNFKLQRRRRRAGARFRLRRF